MPHEPFQLCLLVYQDQYRLLCRSLFYRVQSINGIGIEGISAQTIKTTGGKCNDPALFYD
jgi:hypothetical protein